MDFGRWDVKSTVDVEVEVEVEVVDEEEGRYETGCG